MNMNENIRRVTVAGILCLAAVVMVAGTGCEEEALLGLSGVPSAFGDGEVRGEGDYYYGWTEVGGDGSTRSFSLTPGIDPGESLETYLGGSVIY